MTYENSESRVRNTGLVLRPAAPVPLSSPWLKAAVDTWEAVVMVVPPGTWGDGLPVYAGRGSTPEDFTGRRTMLEAARRSGSVLWGAVRIEFDQP